MVHAELVQRPDRVLAVEGKCEIFEPGDKIPLIENGRQITLRTIDGDQVYVEYDRSDGCHVHTSTLVERLGKLRRSQAGLESSETRAKQQLLWLIPPPPPLSGLSDWLAQPCPSS